MLSEVQVHKAVAEQEQGQQQAEGEWITIGVSENAAEFDLLDIEGIEQFLGSSEIEAGKYTQVRLVVDTIKVAFKDASGNEGELEEAEVPSKELKLVHPFDIVEGETTALVIDFDADKMVTVTGADKVIVKPVVKLTVYQEKSSGQKNGAKQEVALEDTAWILQSYGEPGNLKDVLIDTEITAEFVSSEGTVRGSAGCNSYSGSYEVEDSNLSIPGPIAVTEMYCMEPEGVMDQEQEYLAALQLAESYEIDDDELQMNCGSQVLVFSLE
jgi:heat shock protein HslJ